MNVSRQSQLVAAVLVNAIYEMKNYPIVLLNTVLSPLSFLVLIVFVSHGNLIGQAIEGGFVMSMFSSGLSLQADLSHLKNDFKLQDMIVSSPATWQVYLAGMAISEIVYSLPALLVLSVLAYFFLALTAIQIVEFTAVLALMFLSSISIGFMLSTISSDIVQSFAYSRLLTTLFSTIAPVYYPITYIPLPYRYIAYLSPTTYAAEISQNVAGLLTLPTTTLVIDWLLLFVLSATLILVATKKTRWREK